MKLLIGTSCFIGHTPSAISAPVPGTTEEALQRLDELQQPLVERRTAISHNGDYAAGGAGQTEDQPSADRNMLLGFVTASHGDVGVRVLAATLQLSPVPHALLVMEPNVIVAARQSERSNVIDLNDGTVRAKRNDVDDAFQVFYSQREEGTYFCSARVLEDMHSVDGVMTFRLMQEAAAD